MSRNFFTSDAEYIDFLEQRCRTLATATRGVKEMLEDKNKQIAELSNKIKKLRVANSVAETELNQTKTLNGKLKKGLAQCDEDKAKRLEELIKW